MPIEDDPYWRARIGLSSADHAAMRAQAEQNVRDAYHGGARAMADAGNTGSEFGAAVDKFKAGVQMQMEKLFQQKVSPASGSTHLRLRGAIYPTPPGDDRSANTGQYYADLAHPPGIDAMTTCANADCSRSYVDPHPAAGLASRTDPAELRAHLASLLAGEPVDLGPTITFVNDNRRNPRPNQPLTTPTARMIAAAILQSGAQSANINSSAGGKHVRGPNGESRHYSGKAVDINWVNGAHVSPAKPANSSRTPS